MHACDRVNKITWFDNYFGWLERLLKKVYRFKAGVLLLTVCSILLALAVPLSIQAYEEWKEQELIDLSRRMPGSLDYWRDIVDFKPWFEARGMPFATLGMGLSLAWATLIILRPKKTRVESQG